MRHILSKYNRAGKDTFSKRSTTGVTRMHQPHAMLVLVSQCPHLPPLFLFLHSLVVKLNVLRLPQGLERTCT